MNKNKDLKDQWRPNSNDHMFLFDFIHSIFKLVDFYSLESRSALSCPLCKPKQDLTCRSFLLERNN